jgi:hypothetical protein
VRTAVRANIEMAQSHRLEPEPVTVGVLPNIARVTKWSLLIWLERYLDCLFQAEHANWTPRAVQMLPGNN